MTIARTYANVDLTATGDYISKDSTTDGALKKLDSEIDVIYTHLNNLQCNYYGATEPDSPQAGESWYDSSVGYKKVYNGATWSAEASAAGISNVVEDTTPQLGGNLDLNQFNIIFDPTPDANLGYNGIIETQTAGENVAIGQVCYLKSDGKYWLADADAESTTKGRLLMATTTIAGDATGVFLVKGYIRNDAWAWSAVAQTLYVHTTPGLPTGVKPSGNADVVRIVGYTHSATITYFDPSQEYTVVSA
jgi:hypothetical protein